MRPATQLTLGWLLVCLGACDRAASPAVSIAQAATPSPALMTPAAATPASGSNTSVADAGLAIAIARERTDRAVREQTLHVQQQLRDQERRREAAVHAKENGNSRCLGGQKMRRVPNGWVQDGVC
jgi:hypothetical protein